ncbi:ABC transporter ATP-binding protein [Agromyces neolithicus]|uniref:ABC transporter ATP-binding protein n=1 Tax=Agromyces neolithicus TaxID=269420 RepID=A0ABN2LVU1_9MICO
MNLTVIGVSKCFGSTPVLDAISLDVAQGSRTAIVGASGSGKSTLLRLIAGFAEPDEGRITLGDRTLAALGTSVAAHRRGIGYVAQDGALFPHLTVAGNIAFGLPRGGGAGRTARVREVMELTALDPVLADRYPHQISGGQQQRVALARALAPRPGIILLDEPFSALDTGLREHTRRAVIDALELSGTTAVLVTHDQDEALSFGDGIGVMVDGRLAQAGSPSAVFDDPETAEIAAFLGAAVLLPAKPRDGVAECALGTIRVRHDRSNGSRVALAMVRPAQIDLVTDAPGANAIVHEVRPMGSLAEVSLLAGASGAEHPAVITLRVPPHQIGDLRPGSRVAIRVDGGAVLYPSHDAAYVADEVAGDVTGDATQPAVA